MQVSSKITTITMIDGRRSIFLFVLILFIVIFLSSILISKNFSKVESEKSIENTTLIDNSKEETPEEEISGVDRSDEEHREHGLRGGGRIPTKEKDEEKDKETKGGLNIVGRNLNKYYYEKDYSEELTELKEKKEAIEKALQIERNRLSHGFFDKNIKNLYKKTEQPIINVFEIVSIIGKILGSDFSSLLNQFKPSDKRGPITPEDYTKQDLFSQMIIIKNFVTNLIKEQKTNDILEGTFFNNDKIRVKKLEEEILFTLKSGDRKVELSFENNGIMTFHLFDNLGISYLYFEINQQAQVTQFGWGNYNKKRSKDVENIKADFLSTLFHGIKIIPNANMSKEFYGVDYNGKPNSNQIFGLVSINGEMIKQVYHDFDETQRYINKERNKMLTLLPKDMTLQSFKLLEPQPLVEVTRDNELIQSLEDVLDNLGQLFEKKITGKEFKKSYDKFNRKNNANGDIRLGEKEIIIFGNQGMQFRYNKFIIQIVNMEGKLYISKGGDGSTNIIMDENGNTNVKENFLNTGLITKEYIEYQKNEHNQSTIQMIEYIRTELQNSFKQYIRKDLK